MRLTNVTFTGIDEETDIDRLEDIQLRYPYAEFGLLLSAGWNTNANRYPNPVIASLLADRGLNLSLHLCGDFARTAAETGLYLPFTVSLIQGLPCIFRRCQLNINAMRYMKQLDKDYPLPQGMEEVIIQAADAVQCRRLLDCGLIKPGRAVLIDPSGGRGKDVPFEPVTCPGLKVGYAGGITPDNVEEKILPLLSHEEEGEFWIDMETGVRTDDWLDLDKVERVLEICDSIINN